MVNDWKNSIETLENIKVKILAAMKIEEEWYASHRSWHSFYSRGIRIITIFLFSTGILLPILNLDMITIINKPLNFGYICLVLGGLLLLLDKYLGVSSGYVRFYIAELDIKKNTHEFIINWEIETVKSSDPMTPENILALLNVVKQFQQAIFTIIQVETGAWAAEFQIQTGELYELFKQKQNETIQLVNISVSIENDKEYSSLEVGIDDETLIKLIETNSIIFRNVSAHPHLIRIKALNSENKTFTFSKNIDVVPGKTAELVLTLP